VIWLLLTGAGFVAETVFIVALGRRSMASDGNRESSPPTDRHLTEQAPDARQADVE
jgi:hypothetical protein